MYTIEKIADYLGGKVIGNRDGLILALTPPEELKDKSIVFIKDKRIYREVLERLERNRNIEISFVVPFEPENDGYNYIVIDKNERDISFIKLLELFAEDYKRDGKISENSVVGENCKIDDTAYIGDFTVIENDVEVGKGTIIGEGCFIGRKSRIGDNCIIYPGVKIYSKTIIGNNVIIHSGAVVGSDGFGYSNINGINKKIPQIGGVYIEDYVEIGANTTIDRATIGYTIIGENTKIDNLVQIGHNVKIGKNTIVCAMCGISGSVKIGNNVVIAGAVGLKDHVEIEDNVYIGAKAGVMEKKVKKGSKILGIPAIDFRAEMEFIALKPKLKEMYKDLIKIKKRLGL